MLCFTFSPFFFPPVFNLGLGTNLGVHTDLLKCPIIAHSLESSGWKGFHRYIWHTLSLNHTWQWGDYSLLSPCLLELGSGWQEMDVSGEQSHSEKIGGGGGRVMPHKKSEDFLYCSTAEVGLDLIGSKSQDSTLAVAGIVVSQRNRAGDNRGYFYIAVYVRSRMSTCRELSSAPATAHCQTRLIYIANLPLSIPRFPFSRLRLLSFSLSRRNPSLHVPMQVSIHLNERPSGLTACNSHVFIQHSLDPDKFSKMHTAPEQRGKNAMKWYQAFQVKQKIKASGSHVKYINLHSWGYLSLSGLDKLTSQPFSLAKS